MPKTWACAPVVFVVVVLTAAVAPTSAFASNCRTKKQTDMDRYECLLNSYQDDYVAAIERSKAWILKNGPGNAFSTVKVRLNHWDRAHVRAAVGPSLKVLHLVSNGVTVDVDDLASATNVEDLVLNGTDLKGMAKLAKLSRVQYLGFEVTSNDGVEFQSVLASLPRLATVELSGHFLKDGDAAFVAGLVAGTSVKRVAFLFRPFELRKPQREALEKKAAAAHALAPHVAFEVQERPTDEDTPGAVHDL